MAAETTPMRKTCRRYDIPGHAHYLTFSCFRRLPFLAGSLAPRWLAAAIDAARGRNLFTLWGAFVFMPEHVHLLIQPSADSTVSKILWAIKRPVTERALAHVSRNRPDFLGRMEDCQPNARRTHRFWQRGGGYDRNICSEGELVEKIRYIHNNPVRRGLVPDPGDWPWSSWRAWQEGIDEPIRVDRASVYLR